MAGARWATRLHSGLLIVCLCCMLHLWKFTFWQNSKTGPPLQGNAKRFKEDKTFEDINTALLDSMDQIDTTGGYGAKFLDDQPKLILLLSYQRSGSSFLGSSMFMNNPDIFYVYEPLDSVYTSMYGTWPGLNVPSDITTFKNGSLRVPPDPELAAVRWTMEQLFLCNVTSLRPEILMHYGWEFFAMKMVKIQPYIRCLKRNNISGKKLRFCRTLLPHSRRKRGPRFSPNNADQKQHLKHLWFGDGVDRTFKKKYDDYLSCVHKLAVKLPRCTQVLENLCTTRHIRAIKTVRATMDSVEPLLQTYQNFRLLHLVRDPRGAVLSRHRLWWTKGAYEGSNLTREANVYCQTIGHDLSIRRALEKRYPGRIMGLYYEEFLQQPIRKLREIYNFLHLKLPWKTQDMMLIASNSTKMTSWKKTLTTEEISEIEWQCKDILDQFPFETVDVPLSQK